MPTIGGQALTVHHPDLATCPNPQRHDCFEWRRGGKGAWFILLSDMDITDTGVTVLPSPHCAVLFVSSFR